MVGSVKIVVQVRLMPTPEGASALERTLRTANDAANWLSGQAHERGETSRRALQCLAYLDLKERGLSAQPALHVLRKVADAYSTLKANIRAANLASRSRSGVARPKRSPSRFGTTPPSPMTIAASPGRWTSRR